MPGGLRGATDPPKWDARPGGCRAPLLPPCPRGGGLGGGRRGRLKNPLLPRDGKTVPEKTQGDRASSVARGDPVATEDDGLESRAPLPAAAPRTPGGEGQGTPTVRAPSPSPKDWVGGGWAQGGDTPASCYPRAGGAREPSRRLSGPSMRPGPCLPLLTVGRGGVWVPSAPTEGRATRSPHSG